MENAGDLPSMWFLRVAGAKFMPTDSELVEHFLYNYIHGILSLTQCYPVQECDLYGDKEPWELWKDHQINSHSEPLDTVYLFTNLKRKKANFERRIGNAGGTWHGETAGKTGIPEFRGRVDGLMCAVQKRTFTYWNKQLGSEHGKWKLCEFRIGNLDTVVCRLWNNGSPTAAAEKEKLEKRSSKRKFAEILASLPELIAGPPLKKLQCNRKQSGYSSPIMVEDEATSLGDAIVPVGNETTPIGYYSGLLEESSVLVPTEEIHQNETAPLQEFVYTDPDIAVQCGVEFLLPEKETTQSGDVPKSEDITVLTWSELFGESEEEEEVGDIGAILDGDLATELLEIFDGRQDAIRPGKDGVMMRVDKHEEDDMELLHEEDDMNMLKQPWCPPALLLEKKYDSFCF
ncbi:hypothetical protein LINGRAHAP2_LOCUS16042 [Linum grandiflorum]